MGVSLPYWPEMIEPTTKSSPNAWRASELPPYKGTLPGPEGFNPDGSTPAPYRGHRWLPVRLEEGQVLDMNLFPAAHRTYEAFGPSLNNWAAAAQQHYSFLQHIEDGDTWRYKFDVWDYFHDRVSINFIAFRGGDIIDSYPFPNDDDERYLTTERPKELGRHVVVDGRGLVVHYAFGPQRHGHDDRALMMTDALDRYTAYARERVCPFPRRAASKPVP
jgi:hypothetical protein